MNKLLLIFLLLASSSLARELSLNDALVMAEQHAFVLRRANANREAAFAGLSAAQRERMGSLSITGLASYVSEVSSLSIPLPTGSTLTRELGTHETYQADMRVSLPLYTGGRLSSGIEIARATVQLNEALFQLDRQRLLLLARTGYLAVKRAELLRDAAQASLGRAETIARDVQSLFAAGVADSVAILESQLALARAQIGLSQSSTTLRAEEIRLQTLLDLPLNVPLILTEPLPVPESPVGMSVDTAKPERLVAEAQVSINQARYRLSRADYLPTVAAFGGYSYGKPNLDRFGNTWNDYFTVGGTLTWNFNLGNKAGANRRASQWTLRAAEAEQQNVAETVNRDAEIAYEQLQFVFDRVRSSATEVNIAQRNYELARTQHGEGTLSANRLVTIENDLAVAEASSRAALADYYIALGNYYYAIGANLMERGL